VEPSSAVLGRSRAALGGFCGGFGSVLDLVCNIKSSTGQQRDARVTKGSKETRRETKTSKDKENTKSGKKKSPLMLLYMSRASRSCSDRFYSRLSVAWRISVGAIFGGKNEVKSLLGALGAVLAALESLLVVLGAVLGGLGSFLGHSWALLGRSWGDLGRSWGGLGRSWVDLGLVLGHFGEVLERLGELKTLIFLGFFNDFCKIDVLNKPGHLGWS